MSWFMLRLFRAQISELLARIWKATVKSLLMSQSAPLCNIYTKRPEICECSSVSSRGPVRAFAVTLHFQSKHENPSLQEEPHVTLSPLNHFLSSLSNHTPALALNCSLTQEAFEIFPPRTFSSSCTLSLDFFIAGIFFEEPSLSPLHSLLLLVIIVKL